MLEVIRIIINLLVHCFNSIRTNTVQNLKVDVKCSCVMTHSTTRLMNQTILI